MGKANNMQHDWEKWLGVQEHFYRHYMKGSEFYSEPLSGGEAYVPKSPHELSQSSSYDKKFKAEAHESPIGQGIAIYRRGRSTPIKAFLYGHPKGLKYLIQRGYPHINLPADLRDQVTEQRMSAEDVVKKVSKLMPFFIMIDAQKLEGLRGSRPILFGELMGVDSSKWDFSWRFNPEKPDRIKCKKVHHNYYAITKQRFYQILNEYL